MKFRVGLLGASLHTGNRGVSALGAALATLTWRCRPEATISLLIGNRDARGAEVSIGHGHRLVQTVNYRVSPRAALGRQLWWILVMSVLYRMIPLVAVRRLITRSSPWVEAVVESDFVGDIRGGDSFSDIYGGKNFLLGCLPVLSVIWIRGGVHLLPQTYGPFRSTLASCLARYILIHAQSIWCRDRGSLDEVARLTHGRRAGSLCPDVAFALEAIRVESPAVDVPLLQDSGRALIGINVSGLMYYGGYTRHNMFGLRLDYVTFMKCLVERFLADPSNSVLLVPHTFAPPGRVESDPAACRALKQLLDPSIHDRVHIVVAEYNQHEIKGVIGMCDFFIGSRMHACIAALSQGIPSVGVAYSRKFSGVFDTVGAGDWVIDCRTECLDNAVTRVQELFSQRDDNRPLLRTRVAGTQNALFATFERVLGTMRTPSSSVHALAAALSPSTEL